MFIKLTRFDNRPIWLNAGFIVTVEPRRDGAGSVVVPMGDGFDYDVRESVDEVLAKLEGAPVPTVVPVPVSDCLAPTPKDVSPEPEEKPAPQPEAPAKSSAEPKKPRKRTTKKARTAVAKSTEENPAAAETGAPAANEPAAAPAPEVPAAPKPAPRLELSPDQVVRLGKLAPKSVTKLKNTLATQFHIADVGAAVLALEAEGVVKLDGNRVVWAAPAVG